MRPFLAILAGFAAWTLMWLGGNQLLASKFPNAAARFQEGGRLDDPGYLGAALVLATLCSLFGGRLTGMIAPASGRKPVALLALLLVAVGAAVQVGAWDRMPLWYHLAFLALLAPLTLYGGRGGRL